MIRSASCCGGFMDGTRKYYNSRVGRTGHLWQNRFFACMLADDHLRTAIAYVERNPKNPTGLRNWTQVLNRRHPEPEESEKAERDTLFRLHACAYSGQPFGGEDFVDGIKRALFPATLDPTTPSPPSRQPELPLAWQG